MTKKRLSIGLISVIVIMLITIVTVLIELKDDDKASLDVDLYFLNSTQTSIVSEKRQLDIDGDNTAVKAVADKLFAGPSDTKNKPIFDEGVRLISITENDGFVTVDLSDEFKVDGSTKHYLSTYAIVKSMCQLDEVKEVQVTVGGEALCDTEGKELGFLSAKDIDLVSDDITQDSKNIVLYFPDKSSDKLIAEQRKVKVNDTVALEQYVVEELIKGTQSSKARNVIASDTVLISAQTTDDTCFVNFKSSFIEKNTGNPANEELVIYSVVNSLCQIKGVNFVQFLVDGKKTEQFGSITISEPFSRNQKIIGK